MFYRLCPTFDDAILDWILIYSHCSFEFTVQSGIDRKWSFEKHLARNQKVLEKACLLLLQKEGKVENCLSGSRDG